jgi:hypothetical protein
VDENPYQAPQTPQKPRPSFGILKIVIVSGLVVLALFIAAAVVCTVANI